MSKIVSHLTSLYFVEMPFLFLNDIKLIASSHCTISP